MILNILIVDDDEVDRRHIRRTIKESGLAYECTETISVAEALQACDSRMFDCAVIDYSIPGEDGLSGVSALIARLPFMAIIMSTGQGNETIAAEAMRRGAADYIPKALITPDSIYRSVKNAVDRAALQKKVVDQREELENFARVLVHDLKQPLNSAGGFATVMQQNIADRDFTEIAEYCQIVVGGIERMAGLIDAVSHYVSAEKAAPFEEVSMTRVISDTVTNLDHLIRMRAAKVTFDPLPSVIGNRALLVQLLQNLVANAIKFCEAEVPVLHLSASVQKENRWMFKMQDNGIGIPESAWQQIFQPFKRLHGGEKYEGTGLGLATCKKIVERHSGEIWCESHSAGGTAFFFTLPASSMDAGPILIPPASV